MAEIVGRPKHWPDILYLTKNVIFNSIHFYNIFYISFASKDVHYNIKHIPSLFTHYYIRFPTNPNETGKLNSLWVLANVFFKAVFFLEFMYSWVLLSILKNMLIGQSRKYFGHRIYKNAAKNKNENKKERRKKMVHNNVLYVCVKFRFLRRVSPSMFFFRYSTLISFTLYTFRNKL